MSQVFLLFSLAAAVLPAVLYLLVIWRLDRYEREPFWLTAGVFAYGATVAVFLGVMGSLLGIGVGVVLGLEVDDVFTAVIVAPLAEEPAKGLILLLLLLGRHFDNTTDGLVYGSATGLGFAMTENFFYFLDPYHAGDYEAWKSLVMVRVLFSALMHCTASAALGAVLGRYRFRSVVQQWVLAPLLGLLIAISIHAAFNGLLMATVETGDEVYGMAALVLVPALVVLLFMVIQFSLAAEHQVIKRELLEEARAGVLPFEHAAIIPYVRRRRGDHWLPPGVDKDAYVKAATLLAFRRHQARLRGHATGSANPEIHALRLELFAMLGPDGFER